ncbi:MAG: hypothetical protein ACD_79C00804G0001 [uncultured bacterium]|nr:MAG: hypothetical protein ACD_79C00804G0001 [uncultured bacterium]
MAEIKENTNHLVNEKSPYLLQHAHNPVDWYPWSEEAFDKARKEDKPVFLSIGYSTCHWCHVMEEESFSGKTIADILNRDFISIKVDREERPDIDSVYMNAVQKMTGSGGWPLNVFITPDKKIFYGGTYFAPEQLKIILSSIEDLWKNKREKILKPSEELMNLMNEETLARNHTTEVSDVVFNTAFEFLLSQYDSMYGGFGTFPKFPSSQTFSFLLRYYYRTKNKTALEMVKNSISHILDGGIYDQLGSGIHRYSTDQKWFLPHFEKMLYDQALITKVFLEIYQITREEKYAEAARDILEFVLREMTSPEGVFYSALDADSFNNDENSVKKTEGAFYIWEKKEIIRILGNKTGEIFCYYYGIQEDGNVSNDSHGEFIRKNVLAVSNNLTNTAKHFNMQHKEIENELNRSHQLLFHSREKRPKPFLDDKILTDWNALMISAFAKGGLILNEPRYVNASINSANFVLSRLKTEKGTLLHRYRDQIAGIPGFLDDYAFFINSLLDLYEATFEGIYLKEALALNDKMLELFEDKVNGGFFLTAVGTETILQNRIKEFYDGAYPSGNSIALINLIKLSRITQKNILKQSSKKSIDFISEALSKFPTAYLMSLIALNNSLEPENEIVIVSNDSKDSSVSQINYLIHRFYLSGWSFLFHNMNENDIILSIVPRIRNYALISDKTTIYVCKDNICQPPITDIGRFQEILETEKNKFFPKNNL